MFSDISLKKARNIFTAAMCIAIALFCALPVGAAGNSVQISELSDMTITLPDDMLAITRDSKDTDKYFSVFGLNYERAMSDLASNDIYLQGMDENLAATVTVTMTKTADSESIGDYGKLSQDKLYEVQNNFLKQGEYASCTPDESGKTVWLLLEANVTSNSKTIKAYQAHTVYDSMSINVTLQHNDGDVNSEDFKTFSAVVSSVTFGNSGFMGGYFIYICIGTAVLVIAVLVILVIVTKRAKTRGKKHKNEKILQELASKYTTNRKRKHPASYSSPLPEDEDSYEDISVQPARYEDDYREEKVKIYEKPVSVNEDEITRIVEETLNKEKPEPVSEDVLPDEYAENTAQEKPADNAFEYFDDGESEALTDTEDIDEDDEFADEELLRAEAKRGKFTNSYDFFEEAPKRVVGIIDSADLKNAEDYDVILEEEKRVESIEREQKPKKANSFVAVLAGIGAGIKSFGVHLGYFATNISRMIKRRRAMKKRRKAEAERLERERRRREMQSRQRREENGLVRVHSANDRRRAQNMNTAPSRRPLQSARNSSTNPHRR